MCTCWFLARAHAEASPGCAEAARRARPSVAALAEAAVAPADAQAEPDPQVTGGRAGVGGRGPHADRAADVVVVVGEEPLGAPLDGRLAAAVVVEGRKGGVVVDFDAVDLAADQAAGAVAVGTEVVEVGAAGDGAVDGGGAELPAMRVGAGTGRGGVGEERQDEQGKERGRRASGVRRSLFPAGSVDPADTPDSAMNSVAGTAAVTFVGESPA